MGCGSKMESRGLVGGVIGAVVGCGPKMDG